MASQIQIRRDSAANWTNTNPILAQGEFGLDLTNNYIKIGNGSSAWNDLPYFAANSVDISTVINYLSTNNVLISSLNIIDQLTATDIFGTGTEAIFSDTDSQTGFGEGTLTLNFTNGVYIPTSLTVVGNITGSNLNISNWNSVYTSYQSASGSFATNTAVNSVSSLLTPLTLTNTLTSQLVLNTDFDSYKTNVASATATLLPITTYQSASGSFATNTLLQSTSALLTPLTLTNNLTSQLVLNIDFNNYRTNVAEATATLLPTSIYQATSGNWQNTFTNVQTNSANWSFGYDVATYVQANSANWEESQDITAITTTVASNSSNWNEAYNTATVYQANSAIYATNSIVNSISSQLVLNTDFGSYKTSVASATATLLPITTYQSASGSFVQTVTTTSPGTSAVNRIVAVSAVPVVQETGVLYIVV